MVTRSEPPAPTADEPIDVSDHVEEARLRARTMLGGEAHLGPVDDWRQVLVSARDTVLLVWVVWVLLESAVPHKLHAPVLLALAGCVALLHGVTTGRATATQIAYYATELHRERREIREHFDHECAELRALYAAKGFQEPLLSQVVDTLSADDDRLLKVMMEEELGLSVHHMNHPLVVGLWNFAASLATGLVLTLPLLALSPTAERWWMIGAGTGLAGAIAWLTGRTTGRSAVAMFAATIILAVVAGGTAHYLSAWLTSSHG
jgi:VIT1/CCC1 family predicted Fe2+/Mn2+ transporter